ncbi:unnamed protein product [Lactuca virosa]|uniref:Uncharacterized protein n=1 Tax=Lactuca virosa TaxID=75947 RepID=A0AAU9PI47_9ASTR|nr:unnamed protein product [Lactuca virosa]
MSSRSRRTQPGARPNFPWYTFPNVVTPGLMAQWNGRLAWLRERRVHVPQEINWTWMVEVGLSKAIKPFLVQSFDGTQGQFVCTAWKILFHIQEPVYKELVVEFLATVAFRKKMVFMSQQTSPFVWGERRELSLAEFAMMMELYLPSEIHTESYIDSL